MLGNIVARAAADPVDGFDDFSARAGRTSLGHASLCAFPAPLSVHLMSRALVLRCRTAQQRVARAGRTSLGHASLCAFPARLSVHHMSRALVLRLPHSSVARSVKMIFFATMGARGVCHPPFATVWYGPKIRRKALWQPPPKELQGVQFCDFLCTADARPRLSSRQPV